MIVSTAQLSIDMSGNIICVLLPCKYSDFTVADINEQI